MAEPRDLTASPYELRQVQTPDGLYVHAADVVASLRGRSAEFDQLANESDDEAVAGAYWAVSEAFRVHADQLDVAAIGCVTADPSPWAGGRS
jgi:hypothetical protein